MANELSCVPDDVTLRCGAETTIRVKTSDRAAGVGITALGYDGTVAKVDPERGSTNEKGYLEVRITCMRQEACPGTTTVTFDADGYEEDTLDIECEDWPSPDASPEMSRFVSLEFPARSAKKLVASGLFSALNLGVSTQAETPVEADAKPLDLD